MNVWPVWMKKSFLILLLFACGFGLSNCGGGGGTGEGSDEDPPEPFPVGFLLPTDLNDPIQMFFNTSIDRSPESVNANTVQIRTGDEVLRENNGDPLNIGFQFPANKKQINIFPPAGGWPVGLGNEFHVFVPSFPDVVNNNPDGPDGVNGQPLWLRSLEPNFVVLAYAAVFRGDPVQGVIKINIAPKVIDVQPVTTEGCGDIDIDVTLKDIESDKASIEMEVAVKDEFTGLFGAYTPATISPFTNLATSVTGTTHRVNWEAGADLGDLFVGTVKVKVTSFNLNFTEIGNSFESEEFDIDLTKRIIDVTEDFFEGAYPDLGTINNIRTGDLNGDGLMDIYACSATADTLYMGQEGGSFVVATDIPDTGPSEDVLFFDSEGDGDLDIYLCKANLVDTIYLYQGSNTWEEIPNPTGNPSIFFDPDNQTFTTFGATTFNFDNAGRIDLMLAKFVDSPNPGGGFNPTLSANISILRSQGSNRYVEESVPSYYYQMKLDVLPLNPGGSAGQAPKLLTYTNGGTQIVLIQHVLNKPYMIKGSNSSYTTGLLKKNNEWTGDAVPMFLNSFSLINTAGSSVPEFLGISGTELTAFLNFNTTTVEGWQGDVYSTEIWQPDPNVPGTNVRRNTLFDSDDDKFGTLAATLINDHGTTTIVGISAPNAFGPDDEGGLLFLAVDFNPAGVTEPAVLLTSVSGEDDDEAIDVAFTFGDNAPVEGFQFLQSFNFQNPNANALEATHLLFATGTQLVLFEICADD